MKKKIEEIVAQYKANAEVASKDINSLPYNTRASHQNAIQGAKDSMVVLRKEYDDLLFSNAYGVVLRGDAGKVEEFKNATVGIGGLVYDFDSVYEMIASRIEPTLGFRREFGVNQGFMMSEKLSQILENNGIEFGVKDPNITTFRVVPTYQDVVNCVREVLTHTYGEVLTYLLVRANLLTRALVLGHTKKALAVAFTGGNTDSVMAIAPLFKNIAVLDVTDATIDQTYAISTYNKLNKKKPNQNQIKAESHTEENENE